MRINARYETQLLAHGTKSGSVILFDNLSGATTLHHVGHYSLGHRVDFDAILFALRQLRQPEDISSASMSRAAVDRLHQEMESVIESVYLNQHYLQQPEHQRPWGFQSQDLLIPATQIDGEDGKHE